LGSRSKQLVDVEGLPLPIKAVSDLVVQSKVDPRGLDVVDHKFVAAFSPYKGDKSLFVLQAIFNYYTVKKTFNKPVRRFIVHECKDLAQCRQEPADAPLHHRLSHLSARIYYL
jgi:hypothetical protein